MLRPIGVQAASHAIEQRADDEHAKRRQLELALEQARSTRRTKVTDEDKLSELTVVAGDRATLERELLWSIALNGDPARREQLSRMLTPAANAKLVIAAARGQSQERATE